MIDLVVVIAMLIFIAKLAGGLITGDYDFTVGDMTLFSLTIYVAGVTSIVGWIMHTFNDEESK